MGADRSGRFRLTAVGDVNTYAPFAEHCRELLADKGQAGVIVPTGIATDNTTKDFFAELVSSQNLVSLFDFENRGHLFSALHTKTKFCLLTFSKSPVAKASFAFMLTQVEHLKDSRQVFELSSQELFLFNPNTHTCPLFRTRADMELTRKIYKKLPILIDEHLARNSWGITFAAMFHMSGDSGLFDTFPSESSVRLYEAKMFYHFDHRRATHRKTGVIVHTDSDKIAPDVHSDPRYWISKAETLNRLENRWTRHWLLAYRNITDSRNERSCVFAILPLVGLGHSASIIFPDKKVSTPRVCWLLTNFNSFPLDYVARQKIGGMNLTQTVLNQLPVLPPEEYSNPDILFIAPRVIELIYTAWDIAPFAAEEPNSKPFAHPYYWAAFTFTGA